jgi:tetratricopeptide (TPR) repeat protein
MQEKKPGKAGKQFRKSLDIEGDNFTAQLGYGHLLLRQGEYKKALPHLDKAIELNSGFSLAYADRGKARAKLDKVEGALKDYNRAVELAPENYWNRIDRGRLLLNMGKMDRAKEDFQRAAELKPDYFLAYVYLAGLYNDQDKRQKALEHYSTVLELNPDYYPAYKPAALLAYLQEEYLQAAKHYRRLYNRDDRDHGTALMSAVSLLKAGKQEQGRRYLKKAMGTMDRDSIFYHLARMFREEGYVDYVLNQMKTMDNKTLETRALFYLAVFYELKGNESLARKYYLEVKDAKLFGLHETRIAEQKMQGKIEEPEN